MCLHAPHPRPPLIAFHRLQYRKYVCIPHIIFNLLWCVKQNLQLSVYRKHYPPVAIETRKWRMIVWGAHGCCKASKVWIPLFCLWTGFSWRSQVHASLVLSWRRWGPLLTWWYGEPTLPLPTSTRRLANNRKPRRLFNHSLVQFLYIYMEGLILRRCHISSWVTSSFMPRPYPAHTRRRGLVSLVVSCPDPTQLTREEVWCH